jgi:hypothetical protein
VEGALVVPQRGAGDRLDTESEARREWHERLVLLGVEADELAQCCAGVAGRELELRPREEDVLGELEAGRADQRSRPKGEDNQSHDSLGQGRPSASSAPRTSEKANDEPQPSAAPIATTP